MNINWAPANKFQALAVGKERVGKDAVELVQILGNIQRKYFQIIVRFET